MIDPREVTNSQVANLAIGKIGNREKAINDTKVNCLVNPVAAETIKNNVFIETGTDSAA
jgi:hypothetical protein